MTIRLSEGVYLVIQQRALIASLTYRLFEYIWANWFKSNLFDVDFWKRDKPIVFLFFQINNDLNITFADYEL